MITQSCIGTSVIQYSYADIIYSPICQVSICHPVCLPVTMSLCLSSCLSPCPSVCYFRQCRYRQLLQTFTPLQQSQQQPLVAMSTADSLVAETPASVPRDTSENCFITLQFAVIRPVVFYNLTTHCYHTSGVL